MEDEQVELKPRILGRIGTNVSPLIWRVAPGAPSPDATVLDMARRAGANWVVLPVDLSADDLAQARRWLEGGDWSLVLAVEPDQMQSRGQDPVGNRLGALGLQRCEGVMLQGISASEIKSGRPFHRLMQLRDRGMITTFFVEAGDVADAEWMVSNTPAHAVSLPFGLSDQSAAYRILASAADLGTALVARPVTDPLWTPPEGLDEATEVAFVAAHDRIASQIRDLPRDAAQARSILRAAANPMSEARRNELWSAFQRTIPEPARPVRNLPPEFA